MQLYSLFQPAVSDFIKEVGFPIAAFILVIWLVIYMIRKDEKRQHLSDQRYEKLVNQFIQSMKEISDEHNQALMSISTGFKDTTHKINEYSRDVQTYMKDRDKAVDKIIDKIDDIKNSTNDK